MYESDFRWQRQAPPFCRVSERPYLLLRAGPGPDRLPEQLLCLHPGGDDLLSRGERGRASGCGPVCHSQGKLTDLSIEKGETRKALWMERAIDSFL